MDNIIRAVTPLVRLIVSVYTVSPIHVIDAVEAVSKSYRQIELFNMII